MDCELPVLDDVDVEVAKDKSRSKRLEADVTQEIETWASNVKSSRSSLLGVQLSQKGEPALAYTFLEKQLKTSYSVIASRDDIINSILQKMIEEKIVIVGYNSISNEWRRKLLKWYESHSQEEKLLIPIVGNTISTRRCLSKVEGMGNLKWAKANLPLVEQTFKEIEADLQNLGVIDSEYKSSKERVLEAEKNKQSRTKDLPWLVELDALRAIPISHFDDLVETASSRPFIKLFHLFAAASMGSSTDSTKKNYCEGFRYASLHLKDIGYSGDEDPRKYITPHYLPRFRNYLSDLVSEEKLGTLTANGLLASVRKMLKKATRIKGFGLDAYVDADPFTGTRSTDEYRPYTKAERSRIAEACKLEIEETNQLAKDYEPFDGGSNPVGSDGQIINGLGSLDNARWIFENKLGCQRTSRAFSDPNNVYEKAFSRILSYSSLGIVEIYKSWGVIYEVTSRLLAPYVTRLAQVTGLNADSLKGLDLDDYIPSHEVTRRPCLRYWKERSGGQKMYHLDLMDADFTWLTAVQSREIKKIFDDVAYLTRHIRERAAPAIKNRLFIYESQKQIEYREIKTLEDSVVINLIMNKFSDDHRLLSDAGDKLPISASRLRPSLVSDLVELGASFREIQVILGQKHISTTLKYLDSHEFSKTAQAVVDEALNRIQKNTVQKSPATPKETKSEAHTGSPIPIRTRLVECLNVYDPPEDIKALPDYKPGSPCGLLNKCLSCRNNIITVSNLPDLFAMRRDYRTMLDNNNILSTPYARVVLENLEVLESILTPSPNGFSAEQLEQAERLSEYIITSTLIEGMTL
ncbi:tyrosine-type recombinase/integrase [Pseudomonas aeruginosa]